MFHVKHVETPATPEVAATVFGDRLDAAIRYAELLVTEGVVRGLIGPREAERVWERHLFNSAAIAELIAPGAHVVDAGSGAGLPGIPLALARPDLRVTLVEPMQRRIAFLDEAVEALGLDAKVVRGRVEDTAVGESVGTVDVVTCRAVAGLDKLTRWCLPLLRPGGQLLAIKGGRASDEVDEHRRVMKSLGVGTVRVMKCGGEFLDLPTTVVVVERTPRRQARAQARSGRRP